MKHIFCNIYIIHSTLKKQFSKCPMTSEITTNFKEYLEKSFRSLILIFIS